MAASPGRFDPSAKKLGTTDYTDFTDFRLLTAKAYMGMWVYRNRLLHFLQKR